MSEKRYYTPTIEEFHVGFEFEWLYARTGEWNKVMQSHVYPGEFSNPDGYHPFEWQLSDVGIRVKLLDLDDIMLCGWMINESGITINSGVSSYTMVFIEDESIVGIFDMALNQVVYNGTIKNISELKFIMKRLGIEINLPSYQQVNSAEEK